MDTNYDYIDTFLFTKLISTRDLIQYFYSGMGMLNIFRYLKPPITFKRVSMNMLKLFGIYCIISKIYNNKPNLRMLFFKMIKKNNYVQKKIKKETDKIRDEIKNDLNKPIQNSELYLKLPEESTDNQKIINIFKTYKDESKADLTKISGCIYHQNFQIDDMMSTLFPYFYRTNPLHPDVFPYVRKMEAEIISMSAHLMNSPSPSAGCFTSGGTESILLACKTYRDIAYEKGIKEPEIIVAKNAHAAYWKAGNYFNIKIVEIDSFFDKEYNNIVFDNEIYTALSNTNRRNDDNDEIECTLLKQKLEHVINQNTIAIIASAPSFNHGIIDPISQIADIVIKHCLYLHLDHCLGGFILPFLPNNNKYDFSIEGVTSISMDTHKYGNGPKGGSVLLYNDIELYKKQAFVKDDWSGGIYGTSNLSGSRDGNTIALTWATMMKIGYQGYKKNAETISQLTHYLSTELKKIKEIFVYGNPSTCIVGIGSTEFNIYLLADDLKELGWNLNVLQNPASFHLCITNIHTKDLINKFIKNINDSVRNIMETDNSGNSEKKVKSIYGTTQKIQDGEIISDVVREYICCLNELE